MHINPVKTLCTTLSLSLLASCSTVGELFDPPAIPAPITATHSSGLPNSVVTNFNEALACMDDLMLINQVTPIYLSSPAISNFTSDRSISSGATEMMITALSKMSVRSGGVRYVSFGPDIQNILSLQGAHPRNKDFRAPDFFIRGGITQFNKTLWSGQRGMGASAEIDPGELVHGGTFFILKGQEDITKSISKNKSLGTITVDLNAGFVSNLQMIPGMSSANTLTLENATGTSITSDLSMSGLGLSYSLTDNITKDFNHSMRSLIEVGTIEIIGKLQNVPYWRCLSNAGRIEKLDDELKLLYTQQSINATSKLIQSAQNALKDLKYYQGEINGQVTPTFQDALQNYQRRMGLLSTGLLNYETFRALNVFTPAQSEPYVSWWQNPNPIDRGVITPPVTVPITADSEASSKTASPQNSTLFTTSSNKEGKTILVVNSPTTLRLLSQQQFPPPQPGSVRANFIRAVAAANKTLFIKPELSFDQVLTKGQSIEIPKQFQIKN